MRSIMRIQELLTLVYGGAAAREFMPRLDALLETYRGTFTAPRAPIDQRTVLLVTYGDQLRAENETPLLTLAAFLDAHVQEIITDVHILPFYPSSSDDGFSVMDYYAVDERLGTWGDVARVGEHFDLMFDAVINHASAQGKWFQSFLRDESPYNDYFFTVTNEFVTTNVIRPRALPLLTECETAAGKKWVWTTFSADQIDLNYKNPELLLQILDVLLFYVSRGARFIRLDAIAFLWKESGTTCLHLPQTHAVIQLFRAVLNEIAPHVILVTETNVPHADNISYFGDGTNEAQWVYNFALPPLTLHTLQTGDATKLAQWASTLQTPSPQTAFFNFLASHDGIGLNPARGILTQDEINALVTRTLERGGKISYKNNPDGTTTPYEMNINYLDALTAPEEAEEISVARFLCAHSIMLSLAGVPGIYFHSLFGSRGDRAGADASGIARRINREKFARADLERELASGDARRAQIFTRIAELLRARGHSPAFHPNASQTILDRDARVFAVLRSAENERVLCLHNVTDARVVFEWRGGAGAWRDILSKETVHASETLRVELAPYAVCWLHA
jgi:sucrose phosphorylase